MSYIILYPLREYEKPKFEKQGIWYLIDDRTHNVDPKEPNKICSGESLIPINNPKTVYGPQKQLDLRAIVNRLYPQGTIQANGKIANVWLDIPALDEDGRLIDEYTHLIQFFYLDTNLAIPLKKENV